MNISQTKGNKLKDKNMALSHNGEHVLLNSDHALSTFPMQM